MFYLLLYAVCIYLNRFFPPVQMFSFGGSRLTFFRLLLQTTLLFTPALSTQA